MNSNNQNGHSLTIIDEGQMDSVMPMTPIGHGNQFAISTAIQAAAMMADKRIATARMYPRKISRFKQEATQYLREDIETARSAEYVKPVGGGTVRGASIRLAELAAMCWGNLEVEVAEPIIGDKSVTVKATAWDLERNYRQDGIATTSIVNRNGQRYQQHMIETAVMATASKAKRNAILAVIPRTYIQDLLQVAKEVAAGKQKPLEQQRIEMLDYFQRTYKVQPEQIFEFLGMGGLDDIGDNEIDLLRGVVTAIKEGSSLDEYFKPQATSKADAVKAKIEARKTLAAKTEKNDGRLPGLGGDNPESVNDLKATIGK